jgi:hypothetical protein
MYDQTEINRCDQEIFQFCKNASQRDLSVERAKSMHDFTIKEVLLHHLQGKQASM